MVVSEEVRMKREVIGAAVAVPGLLLLPGWRQSDAWLGANSNSTSSAFRRISSIER